MSRKTTSKPVLSPAETISLQYLLGLSAEHKRLLAQGGTITDLLALVGSNYPEMAQRLLPGIIALKKYDDYAG